MPRKKKQPEPSPLTPEEEMSLDAVESASLLESDVDLDSLDGLDLPEQAEPTPSSPPPPSMTDVGWTDHVLSHFAPGEVDEEGRPFVHGLRRVGRLLLGPVVTSRPKSVQPAHHTDGGMQPAVVDYELEILWNRQDELCGQVVRFGGLASVHAGLEGVYAANCEPTFCRFADATAETRAEGRAWRKALMLGRVCAAEEMTTVPPEISAAPGSITKSQLTFMDMLCRRNNVDAYKFINSRERGGQRTFQPDSVKYPDVTLVPQSAATMMVDVLSDLNTKNAKNGDVIHDSLKGYREGWAE